MTSWQMREAHKGLFLRRPRLVATMTDLSHGGEREGLKAPTTQGSSRCRIPDGSGDVRGCVLVAGNSSLSRRGAGDHPARRGDLSGPSRRPSRHRNGTRERRDLGPLGGPTRLRQITGLLRAEPGFLGVEGNGARGCAFVRGVAPTWRQHHARNWRPVRPGGVGGRSTAHLRQRTGTTARRLRRRLPRRLHPCVCVPQGSAHCIPAARAS